MQAVHRCMPLLILLFSLGCLNFSEAEGLIRAVPSEVRAGEIVDVDVRKDSDAISLIYRLTRNGEPVFQGKEDTHFLSSFCPREEGNYTLEVSVQCADGTVRTEQTEIQVSGTSAPQQGQDLIYSQKDGTWKDKAYSRSDLENAGCAIFTLSHALQRIGLRGDNLEPQQMAVDYKSCYSKYGTMNNRLIERASKNFGYTTKNELVKSKAELKESLQYGDQFSFGIVNGHIALMTAIDPKHDKVLIIDSAPSATFERIKRGSIYYLEDGEYREASDPGEIPGSRYYFETRFYGGLAYYMDLDYCARKGGRLIRPAWFSWQDDPGSVNVRMISLGSGQCVIQAEQQTLKVPTRELKWGEGGETKLAISAGNKSIILYNTERKRISTIPPYTLVPVLKTEDGIATVIYQNKRGRIKMDDVEILDPLQGESRTGVLSVNGKTDGKAMIRVRVGPSEKNHILESWRVGTEVTLVDEEGEFWLAEAGGRRAWIRKDCVVSGE